MSTHRGPVITCKRCGRQRPHTSRGVCEACHYHVIRYGLTDEYPRSTWPRELLLAEWEWLRRQGYSRAQAAERLGVSKDAIDKAIARERRASA
jgi:predicted DNA-binding protein (UPF0251 family)